MNKLPPLSLNYQLSRQDMNSMENKPLLSSLLVGENDEIDNGKNDEIDNGENDDNEEKIMELEKEKNIIEEQLQKQLANRDKQIKLLMNQEAIDVADMHEKFDELENENEILTEKYAEAKQLFKYTWWNYFYMACVVVFGLLSIIGVFVDNETMFCIKPLVRIMSVISSLCNYAATRRLDWKIHTGLFATGIMASVGATVFKTIQMKSRNKFTDCISFIN